MSISLPVVFHHFYSWIHSLQQQSHDQNKNEHLKAKEEKWNTNKHVVFLCRRVALKRSWPTDDRRILIFFEISSTDWTWGLSHHRDHITLCCTHSSWTVMVWRSSDACNWTGVLRFLAASEDVACSNSYLGIVWATSASLKQIQNVDRNAVFFTELGLVRNTAVTVTVKTRHFR